MLSASSQESGIRPEWPLYDHELYFNTLRNNSRFRNMRMEFLYKLLAGKSQFDYIRFFALDQLQHRFLMKCNIFLYLGTIDAPQEKEPTEELSTGIFKWGYQDFVQRRQLGNLLYVDVLNMKSDACLKMYKFKTDVYELLNLVTPVFEAAYAGIFYENFPIKEALDEPIENAHKLMSTINNIEKELNKNQKKFMQSFNRNFIMANTKRDSTQKLIRTQLETRLMNNHIWDPIEVRYQLNWYASKVNQAQYKHDQMVDGYETQLDYYRQRAEYDKRCTHNCMDYLYMSIDTLKSLLNDFQKKYDNDYEKIENRVAYQRIQIDKLREQRRFLTEAIQRFHEETEQMRIYEEELQAKRDLQRQKEMSLYKRKSKRSLLGSKSKGKAKAKGK